MKMYRHVPRAPYIRAGIAVDQRPATGVNRARPLAYDIAFSPASQPLLPYRWVFYLLAVSTDMLRTHQRQGHQKTYIVRYQRTLYFEVQSEDPQRPTVFW